MIEVKIGILPNQGPFKDTHYTINIDSEEKHVCESLQYQPGTLTLDYEEIHSFCELLDSYPATWRKSRFLLDGSRYPLEALSKPPIDFGMKSRLGKDGWGLNIQEISFGMKSLEFCFDRMRYKETGCIFNVSSMPEVVLSLYKGYYSNRFDFKPKQMVECIQRGLQEIIDTDLLWENDSVKYKIGRSQVKLLSLSKNTKLESVLNQIDPHEFYSMLLAESSFVKFQLYKVHSSRGPKEDETSGFKYINQENLIKNLEIAEIFSQTHGVSVPTEIVQELISAVIDYGITPKIIMTAKTGPSSGMTTYGFKAIDTRNLVCRIRALGK
jgi:hypothetical protein